MIPSSFEGILLVLLFFLPGYVYFVVKSWFKFQSWNNKEILFLGFIFNSLIFQFLSFVFLKYRGINVVIPANIEFNSFLFSNLSWIGNQLFFSVIFALVVSLFFSLKQTRRLMSKISFLLRKFLNFGLDYTPAILSVFENSNNFGEKFTGCVIELKDGTLYDGNIFHIGFNTENKDHLIVLAKVTSLKNGIKKKYPDELKVLVPYENINTISYKEYEFEGKKKKNGFIKLNLLTLSLLLILVLLLLLWFLQCQISVSEWLKTITELFGAFVVTFLGVSISLSYSKKSDQDKEKNERERIYLSGLKLLFSELSLDEQHLSVISEAIDTIPDKPEKNYNNFGFLMEMGRTIRTNVFYNLISSGGMDELNKDDELFSKIQMAYYNLQKAIDGISLSREMFKDFSNLPINTIPIKNIMEMKEIIRQESQKIKDSLEMIKIAKDLIRIELGKYEIVFDEEGF